MAMYGIKKQSGLEEILALTHQAVQMLENEAYDEIDSLMNRRQEVMDQITAWDAQEDATLVEAERKRLLPLLEEILEYDRKLTDLIEIRKQEAAQAMQKLKISRKLNHSYQRSYSNQDGYYIDQTIGSRRR
jgi:hypothetical protein